MSDLSRTIRIPNAIKHLNYCPVVAENGRHLGTPQGLDNLQVNLWLFEQSSQSGQPSAAQRGLQYAMQITTGCRMVVDRAVSDLMRETDFKQVSFEDITWPAPSVEMFFEDPTLPTCLLLYASDRTVRPVLDEHLPNYDLEFSDGVRHMMLAYEAHDAGNRATYTLAIPHTKFFEVLEAADNVRLGGGMVISSSDPIQRPPPVLDSALDDQEEPRTRALLRLAFRCLAYACIPQATTQLPAGFRRSPHGSHAGIRGRPETKRPVSHVRLLPSLVRASGPKPEASAKIQGSGGSVTPHDRRPHLRVLRHPKWGSRVGQVILVAGAKVRGGSGLRAEYRVRKVVGV